MDSSSNSSFGIIECRGITAAIKASDGMAKCARISFVGSQKIGHGLIFVIIEGPISDIDTALHVGASIVEESGELVSAHQITHPADDIRKIIMYLCR